jgi:BASS family bile acid:Na+ symporter
MPVPLLRASARHGSLLLALSIFGGIAFAPLAAAVRDLVTPAVALLMTLVLLRIDPAQVLAWVRRPGRVALVSAWVLLACPLIAFAATRALGMDGSLGSGVVLMAAAAGATTAPAFARLVGLDPEICLVVAVVTTLLVPLTAPPLALGLIGLDLAISMGGLMLRLGLIVGLPGLAALLLRRVLGKARLEAAGPGLDGAVVLVLVVFAFGIMDGVQARLLADPLWVLGGMAAALAASLGLNAVTMLALAPGLGRGAGLAAGYLAGTRNQALFLAVLPAGADPGVLLFFALGQVPMFIGPFLLRPVYARVLRR